MSSSPSVGLFGQFGGRFVPETLMAALDEFESAYKKLKHEAEEGFRRELADVLTDFFVGRPTPLTEAKKFAASSPAASACSSSAKTSPIPGRTRSTTPWARRSSRSGSASAASSPRREPANTASLTATVCARFGLECVVYMGSEDMRRQRPNVERMGLLGAEVRPVEFGTRTLKEATSEAIRDWISNVHTTYYLIGSCVGPHPYPAIVRELQAVIGREARSQILEQLGRLPDAVIACVGGGSNAIGLFAGFLADEEVRLVGVEAEGAASLSAGRSSVLHGSRSSVLADADGQVLDAHSISAGLDYPGVGPEHAHLRDSGRALRDGHRRGGHRSLPPARVARGNPFGARACSCARPRTRHRCRDDSRRPVGTRGQGSRRGALALSKSLVIYLMAGPETPEFAAAAVAGGADIVELGFPFSDPLADGPTIGLGGARLAAVRTAAALTAWHARASGSTSRSYR